jgi:hypothetical protein
MKKILIIAAVLIGSVSAKGQVPCGGGLFPTIDSLRAFINIHIRNSAINSFTNLRLNSAAVGVTQWLDCIRNKGMDSIHVVDAAGSDPDTIKVYRAGAFSFYKLIPAGGSGSNNATSGEGGFRLLNLGTQTLRELTPGVAAIMDTTLSGRVRIGVDTAALPRDTLVQEIGQKITQSGGQVTFSTKSPVFKNLAEMRAVGAALLDTGTIYFRNTSGIFIPYKWNSTSTSTDDSVTVIQRTGTATGRFELYFENYIHVDWFGAISGDGNEDSWYVQKAINFAVASSKSPEIRFGGGNYIVNNVVIYNEGTGGNYDFVTATLKGTNSVLSGSTVFTCTDTAGFSIAIQVAKGVTIENITFVGQSPQPSDYEDVITWTDAEWIDGVRANIYSPHAAIMIDPFSFYLGAGNQYAGSTAYYTNTSAGGSSQITIRNCSFKYFVVAIGANLGVNTQNGDNIIATECYFEKNKIVWAAGQTQTRANVLEKSYMLFNQFIINGGDFGQQVGTLPLVSHCNIAGGTKYLYKVNSEFAGATFSQTRMESLWSFGKSLQMPINFTDCEITMSIPGSDGAFAARLLAEGKHVNFRGGSLEWFDNTYVAGFPFYVENLSFDGVSLRGLPVNFRPAANEQTLINKTLFQNCWYYTSSNEVWNASIWRGISVSALNNRAIMPGTTIIEDHPSVAAYYNIYRVESQKIERYSIESKTLNIDSTANTAYFLATAPEIYKVNDLLTTTTAVSYAGDIYTASMATVLGWVYEISGDTIKLKYVPYGLDESTSYAIYLTRVPRYIGRTFGTISSGSNTITGVTYATTSSTFVVGSYIKGTGIPTGTRVTAVTATTITLSRNATGSGAVELYDAIVRGEGWSDDPLDAAGFIGWTIGDRIYNTRTYGPNANIAHWVCTSAGFTDGSGTPVASWLPVYHTDALKANLASPTFTGTPAAPTATAGTNTTQIATTQFVQSALANVTSATYTPTLTNVTNITSSVFRGARYIRVGDQVSVSITIDVETTGAGGTQIDFTLPIASDFSNRYSLDGTGSNGAVSGSVFGESTNDRATLNFSATGAGTTIWTIKFQYTILAP